MTRTHYSPNSLRRTLLLRVGGLVIGTVLLVGGTLTWVGLRPMTQRIAESQFDGAAAGVATGLSAMFAPIADLLRMSRYWIGEQAPDLDQSEVFNRQFQPILATLPHATSIVAGTSSGQGWLLLHQPDGGWRNRMTDNARWGMRHLVIDHLANGRTDSSWQEFSYDARTRPWYAAAVAAGDDVVV